MRLSLEPCKVREGEADVPGGFLASLLQASDSATLFDEELIASSDRVCRVVKIVGRRSKGAKALSTVYRSPHSCNGRVSGRRTHQAGGFVVTTFTEPSRDHCFWLARGRELSSGALQSSRLVRMPQAAGRIK
jgi:hypothetical protein